MAATPSVGLAHVTVVPTNFVPPTKDDEALDDERPGGEPAA